MVVAHSRLQKRVLYIGTGVNYSNPPTDTSDAILAIDMDSGRLLWSQQLTAADSYNFACGAEDKTNCPKLPFVDYDFGHSPVLRNRILFAGDKGGTVYALDADQQGKLLWKQKIASGGVNGGFMWGAASDDQGVGYIGISDFTPGKPEVGGGLVAFQLKTGEKLVDDSCAQARLHRDSWMQRRAACSGDCDPGRRVPRIIRRTHPRI